MKFEPLLDIELIQFTYQSNKILDFPNTNFTDNSTLFCNNSFILQNNINSNYIILIYF
jgi:hypothetical protein